MTEQSYFWKFIQNWNQNLKEVLGTPPLLSLQHSLFTIANISKHLKCLAGEWIGEMWCVYTMEYYSAFKKEDILQCDNIDEPWGHNAKWSMF